MACIADLGATLERRADGAMLIRSTGTVTDSPTLLPWHLERWAQKAPDRTFLAKRRGGGDWQRLTYAEAAAGARAIAGNLRARGLSSERPVAILSGNDIEHALVALGAMYAGVPYAPISPAYALLSTDFAKLRDILMRLTPGLVFVDDASRFAKAIAAACPLGIEVVATCFASIDGRPAPTPFHALLAPNDAGPALDAARPGPVPGPALGLDAVAKILFTSGSTGSPKGVITTHRMLAVNQAMLQQWLPDLLDVPPVLVDWLPWNHTFGGSHNFGLVLANGGTLYIDDGRPTPAGIAETLRNLREIAPTMYFNVPKGYEEIVRGLGADRELQRTFFSRLRLVFTAAASLTPHIASELDRLALAMTGAPILIATGFGSTETAPACIASTRSTAKPGNIGVPLPGVTLKLVPTDGKLEARVKGPNITPGYWRDAEQTRAAFDAEGFYLLGDALQFAEGCDPSKGLMFDGRLSEDFKLDTGTWVSAGPLRVRLNAALSPFARDAVIAGHDRGAVTALVFPDVEAARALLGAEAVGVGDADVLSSPVVCEAVRVRLAALACESTGSSTRVRRVILLAEPPSIDAGEITDKGSINQRAVLSRRAALVAELYNAKTSPRVISAE